MRATAEGPPRRQVRQQSVRARALAEDLVLDNQMNNNRQEMEMKTTRTRKARDSRRRAQRVRLQHLYLRLLDTWSLYKRTFDTTHAESALRRLLEEENAYRAEFDPLSEQERNALELVRFFAHASLNLECFGDYVHWAYKYAIETVASVLKSEGASVCDCGNRHGSRVETAVH